MRRSCFIACLVAVCMAGLTGSCRSSRKTAESSATSEAVSVYSASAMHSQDTGSASFESMAVQADTSAARHTGSGRIDIERDAAGRPAVICWQAVSLSDFWAMRRTDFGLFGAVSGSKSEVSHTSAGSTAAKEETSEETVAESPARSAEKTLGQLILLAVAVYILWTRIEKIWKR